MSEIEKMHMLNAFSFELSHCDDPTVYTTAIPRINDIDHELAKNVAQNVGGAPPDRPGRTNHGRTTVRLSQFDFMPSTPTIKSRRIAILVADGFDLATVEAFRVAMKAGGATTWMIGPRRNKIYPAGQSPGSGEGLAMDHHFEGQRSTLFDALFIPGGVQHAQALASNGRAIHWILEAFGHLKTIGALGECQPSVV